MIDSYLILVGIIIFILAILRIKLHVTNCMWYWDGVDHCWVTQCKGKFRIVGEDKSVPSKNCVFCKKPIAVNHFIVRSEGRA